MTRLSEEAQFIPVRKKSASRKMDCTAYGTCPERDSTMNQDHENHSDNQFSNKFSLQHSPSQLDVSGIPRGQDKVGEQGITLPILLGCCILGFVSTSGKLSETGETCEAPAESTHSQTQVTLGQEHNPTGTSFPNPS